MAKLQTPSLIDSLLEESRQKERRQEKEEEGGMVNVK